MTPIERRAIDYSELEQGMAHLEQAIRDKRRTLDALARGEVVAGTVLSRHVAQARSGAAPETDPAPDPLPEDVSIDEDG